MKKPFQETLRPLLTSMRLVSLYYNVDNPNVISSETSSEAIKARILRRFFSPVAYGAIVLILLWFNFIRFCVGILPNDEGFAIRLIMVTWFGLCAVNATILFFGCRKSLPEFEKNWNDLFDDILSSEKRCQCVVTKRYVICVTVIAWVMVVLNITGVLFLTHTDWEAARGFRLNHIRPFPESIAVLVVISVLHALETAAWIFPVAFVICVCFTVKVNFNNFSKSLETHIQESNGNIPADLQSFRKRHVRMCNAVAILDRVFGYLMAASFGFNILLCCFVLYSLVNVKLDPLSLAVYIFWLVSSGGGMLATALSSAQVNAAVHSPLDHMFEMDTHGASSEQIGQLNLFVAKLTGTTVGFSVLDMVVVTKELIMTLGGVFVTYFFLLLQFKVD